MTNKINEKYNTSCVKLFEFIEMLYKGDVEFKTVIEHFSEGQYDGTSNTHVTLNKYLNAMKIFGLKVQKQNHKYNITTPLYSISFNVEDIQSFNKLKKAMVILPEGKVKNGFKSFIKAVEVRFDEKTRDAIDSMKSNVVLDLDFSHALILDQIKMCEKYCQDNMKLEIVFFKGISRKEVNLLCSPVEVLYVKKTICLKVAGNNGGRIYQIPLEDIKSIKQLPVAASNVSLPTTVVFKVKNRLALNYKLKDCERLDGIKSDGSKIVVNKGEDFNILIRRLMKYGTNCELISPKFLRDEMLELINKTLSKYKL